MSTSINDGGPAYPCESYVLKNGKQVTEEAQGMSLRDYFAGKVLSAIYAHRDSNGWPSKVIATQSYLMADAMLVARKEDSK
jgi:hypothetical protein